MEPFFISDFNMGVSIGKNELIMLQTRITNLFNVEYQAIRSYPMPGRGYYLTMIIRLKKVQNNSNTQNNLNNDI